MSKFNEVYLKIPMDSGSKAYDFYKEFMDKATELSQSEGTQEYSDYMKKKIRT